MSNGSVYPGLFDRYQPLRGRDWIRRIPAEDRAVFSHIGLQHGDYGRSGGIARAMTARRDRRGRFAPNLLARFRAERKK